MEGYTENHNYIRHSTLKSSHFFFVSPFQQKHDNWCLYMAFIYALLQSIVNNQRFILFSQLNFKSKAINNLAKSVLAVYLIHCQPTIHKFVIMPIVETISRNAFSLSFFELSGGIELYKIQVFFYTAGSAILVMTGCIIIDKSLFPIWLFGKIILQKISTKFANKKFHDVK